MIVTLSMEKKLRYRATLARATTMGDLAELHQLPKDPGAAAEAIRDWLVTHADATREQVALLSRHDLFDTLDDLAQRRKRT